MAKPKPTKPRRPTLQPRAAPPVEETPEPEGETRFLRKVERRPGTQLRRLRDQAVLNQFPPDVAADNPPYEEPIPTDITAGLSEEEQAREEAAHSASSEAVFDTRGEEGVSQEEADALREHTSQWRHWRHRPRAGRQPDHSGLSEEEQAREEERQADEELELNQFHKYRTDKMEGSPRVEGRPHWAEEWERMSPAQQEYELRLYRRRNRRRRRDSPAQGYSTTLNPPSYPLDD